MACNAASARPGMLTTLIEFLRDNPDPTEQEVRIAISGNLCRCTGYQNIVIAALDAAKRLQATSEAWRTAVNGRTKPDLLIAAACVTPSVRPG